MMLKSPITTLAFIFLFIHCKNDPQQKVKEAPIGFKKEAVLSIINNENRDVATFDIELASSPYERQTGLMYRETMKENQGMLFVFEAAAPRSFYMKNTLIPLDLIFLNANLEIISIQKNTIPKSMDPIPSNGDAQYVLEIIGGQSDALQITPGMKIKYTVL